MPRFLISLVIGALIGAPIAYGIEILKVGRYSGESITTKTKEGWMVLSGDDGKFFLQSVSVAIEAVNDPLVDEPTQKTGKLIRISDKNVNNPLLLIHGAKLEEGTVAGQIMKRNRFIHPGEALNVTVGEEISFLVASGSARNSDVATEFTFHDYELTLVPHNYKPIKLAKFKTLGFNARPTIRWVGDLNRDGYLDVIADLSDHYAAERPTLFLSDASKDKVELKKVAELELSGC